MAAGDVLRDVVERTVVSDHVGKSGAGLERVRLRDGRALVVKRVDPQHDVTLALTGGGPSREFLLWRDGVFDRLPAGIGHAVVDGWVEGDCTVLVLRDLGDRVLSWDDRLSADRAARTMTAIASLHRSFLCHPPPGLAPLDLVVTLFTPRRIREAAVADVDLMRLALRGWELFADAVPADVAGPVLALLDEPAPLVAALRRAPTTLAHGDLATVNMAFEGDDLVLIDWAMATQGPGTLDVARFVAGCSSVVDATREDLLGWYRAAAGPACDDQTMHLGLLSAMVWLGWNKALDAVEHPDPVVRARERADLDWWVQATRTALQSGAI
ncbi:hypothetical protein BJ986_000322 [Phycicoccus badiiscoriae]|uniref:Aminoglycoside phosphotransferase domain-containing protein n=1 Tax=Pedococcus badiiscoriae TaxID=642776 RepID=A0A852WHV3_9MICO|nr:hypothetical protein [Pedococcus badiiscoriae]